MKTILTGSTGFIGGEILEQCAAHAQITSTVVRSQRALPDPTALRPSGVLQKQKYGIITARCPNKFVIGADELAAAMIEIRLKEDSKERIVHTALLEKEKLCSGKPSDHFETDLITVVRFVIGGCVDSHSSKTTNAVMNSRIKRLLRLRHSVKNCTIASLCDRWGEDRPRNRPVHVALLDESQ
ncbi:uncharacterized protein Z519_08072 [Cladophialophora bantiana CBS 173.52]|uniref:Thioester reductase (TE) domain-containing protein n=1 Tax=Cladophialophora bantiana (strain ATCC 10958 / CBS 173.52 / CDC B-1940 / NIH 8579) TaxID=1442370 RepID=A0A0D2FXF9_CLAB1|nr:uncharacterized protein Z519_08072 [Cladophialophora bantiana CBS 173.52]KIW91177.1 hypothetical protein Z519_08072 [Cladophialophora bantiana CBS 173.52]